MSTSIDLTRNWPTDVTLSTALRAGAIVSATEPTEKKAANPDELLEVLRVRLIKFDELLGAPRIARHNDLDLLKLNTAFASLFVLEHVQAALVAQESSSQKSAGPAPPLLGSRDLAQSRTHLAIVFKWGVEFVLARVVPSLSNKRSPKLPPEAQVIDLTSLSEDYALLKELANRLLALLFPGGPKGDVSQTLLAKTILSRGFTDLLRPFVVIGWLPERFHADILPSLDVQVYTFRLLECTPPSQTIASLGQVISQPTLVPAYARGVCSRLLSNQLLRSAGVAGLFSAMFGEDKTSTEAPLVKLENVTKVLNSVPSSQTPESYYPAIMTRLLHLLTPDMAQLTPPAHKRAAAFALSRILISTPRGQSDQTDIRLRVIEWSLLDSFHPDSYLENGFSQIRLAETEADDARSSVKSMLILSPADAIPTLSTIVTNTDPSPELFTLLLQPIIPQLYSLLERLLSNKVADPVLVETVEGLLSTWASAADKSEVVDALWSIIQGDGNAWGVDDDGKLTAFPRENKLPSLTMAQLADLQEGKLDEGDDGGGNFLNLYPHPARFARFLTSIKRDNVPSVLYSRILNAHVQLASKGDPLRKLLFFKLMMQISLHEGDTARSIRVASPSQDVLHQLMFIKLSLDRGSDGASRQSDRFSYDGIRLAGDGEDMSDSEDNDADELVPGLEGFEKSEYLIATAINLLLALLEVHPELSPGTEPLLNEIYSQLELIANSASDALRPRAREARLTLTARLASSSLGKDRKQVREGDETPQEKYERALRLLQDPLLPVRAHGLLILRELVAPQKMQSWTGKMKKEGSGFSKLGAQDSIIQGAPFAAPTISRTLVPDILEIFMHAIRDDDSYIFLNAVQGLAAMVDSFGEDVLRKLVSLYAGKLVDGSDVSVHKQMTNQEVDTHVKLGEALEQVIRRSGDALGRYVDIIVPPIFALVRKTHLPTTIRTSAVSLLAATADTNAFALSAYMDDLLSSMIDLIQIESMSASITSRLKASAKEQETAKASSSDQRANRDVRKTEDDAVIKAEAARDNRQERSSWNESESSKNRIDIDAGVKHSDVNGSEIGDGSNMLDTMDAQPTAVNAKFPPLRRAALHFVALLLRSLTASMYGTAVAPAASAADSGISVSALIVKRGVTVLGYVAATDADELVRIMAREAAEQVGQLKRALVGL